MTSLPPAPAPWRPLLRLVAWLADLRLAIVLLLLIATASGLGTAIPQKEAAAFYHQRYDDAPWLGWLKADGLLRLQLDHVYSSGWFLALLALLGLALLLCSWRRQWPALQASLRWTDYTTPRQLSKLTLAETFPAPQDDALKMLADQLRAKGWSVREREGRFAARKGVVGRVGPLLVHAGMVVLMVGAAWGALAGQRLERFLAPGSDLQLLDRQGRPQVTVALDRFSIARDPAGRPEQFTSSLRLIPPAAAESAPRTTDDPLPAATRPPLSPATPLAASAAASAAVNPTAPASAITDLPGSAHPAPAAVDSAAAAVPAPSSAVAEPAADPLSALVFPGVADPPPSAADSVPAAASTPALVRSGPASRAMPPPLPAPPPPPPPPTLPARNPVRQAEISVNHPLRYKGITLYQADWTLASIQIQLGRSPVLELPLQRFPQLGEEVWGLLLPTRPDGSQLVLLTLSSEEGPVEVFGADGASLGVLRPGGDPLDVRGLPVRVVGVVPASGVLFKRDPGVPLVYSGFAIVLLGGALSLVATRQLWVVEERREDGPWVHAAGLCNRNLTAFARELPSLLEGIASPLRGQG